MLRIALIVFGMIAAVVARAQCSIQVTSAKVCLGATTSFSSSPLSAADSAWNWNFGDGGSSSQPAPSYQYRAAGVYTATLRKYFTGGTYCDAAPLKIIVVTRPVSRFSNTTKYRQCFETNSFLFRDESVPGLSGAPLIQRTMIYDDGAFAIQQAPFTDSLWHRYTHPAGDTYTIVLEVKDTNGCITQYIDSVVVFPAMHPLDLNATLTDDCYYTDVTFKHNGFYQQSNTSRIRWMPGNGDTIQAPPYNNYTHRYLANSGVFLPSLMVTDLNGCEKRDTLQFLINRSMLDTVLHINKPVQCILNNQFRFYNASLNTTLLRWTISNDNTKRQSDGNTFIVPLNECGLYNVKLELSNGKCTFVKDTQVLVNGHWVLADASPAYQCIAKDTIEFAGSYNACDTTKKDMHFLWSFGDNFALPCTTSTKYGINVGVNCNFSTDEKDVKHFYTQPSPLCYQPYLVITDSVSMCVAATPLNISISDVDVGWDSSLAVPRRGVYYSYDLTDSCSNKIRFNFDELKPFCRPEKIYFLRDSLCSPHQWMDMALDTMQGWVDYSNRCTPGFILTYGVVGITGTGPDACYDTAWYRLQLPNLKKVKLQHRVIRPNTCKPFDVAFEISDSVNYGIDELMCNFGDNTFNYFKAYTQPADTILQSFTHVYKKPGVYAYTVQYKLKTGCYLAYRDTVRVGKYALVSNLKPKVCFPDSVHFEAGAAYYTLEKDSLWADSTRALAGKEALYWNFGDDASWYRAGGQVSHVYQHAGVYQVSLVIKDSTASGCYDTIATSDMQVEASRLVMNVSMLNDTFFCAPTIINYVDSSYVLLNDSTRTYQTISTRLWNFGTDKPESDLQSAGIFYGSNGEYLTRLRVTAQQGCVADTLINIWIIGPQPRFVIIGDTFGCTPYTVKLKNETGKQLAGWIWYFNDPANQILSTGMDTMITFTYTDSGTYRIDLFGEDRIYNTTTGTYSNCSEKFPYQAQPTDFHSRQVTVFKTDSLRIEALDSLCLGERLFLSASGTRQVNQVICNFGDRNESKEPIDVPVSHTYDTINTYLLKVQPVITMPHQCVIGAEKMIHVQFPYAGFEYNDAAYPEFSFINKSAAAVRYLWNFGQPSSPRNTSQETNPVHRYVNENKNVTVCLMAFDELGCMDSICKLILLRPSIKIPNVFTPGNGDEANDAFDIEIEGWEKYEAYIYNRWGTLVYEAHTDGIKNDGINWDGTNKNAGNACPEGVYYLVFNYRLMNQPQDQTYHGTITLIRNKR